MDRLNISDGLARFGRNRLFFWLGGTMSKAWIILEDGSVFPGERFGSPREVICEMVFNTGLTGYLELLTDASYAGQGIVMASPIIGNYGVFTEQSESDRPWADALIVRDLTHIVGDERDAEDLDDYLIRHDIPGICGVDTRTLTLTLREKGTMNGMITAGAEYDLEACLSRIRAHANPCPVARVSRKTPKTYPAGACGRTDREMGMRRPPDSLNEIFFRVDPTVPARYRIAMLDFGLKQNIVWNLTRRGCEVTVYPWDTPAAVILRDQPDGIMLSNGPGDPVDCAPILPEIRALYQSGTVVFGICLGHQLVALATGARTRKLKYGHRGSIIQSKTWLPAGCTSPRRTMAMSLSTRPSIRRWRQSAISMSMMAPVRDCAIGNIPSRRSSITRKERRSTRFRISV
jgi:carbamoyl-phosphate synthase small subunit